MALDGDSAPPKGGRAAPPLFGPCLLWPNGWMDHDALGTEVGLGPDDVVRWGPSSPHGGKHIPHTLFGPLARSPISAAAEQLFDVSIGTHRRNETQSHSCDCGSGTLYWCGCGYFPVGQLNFAALIKYI